MEYSGEVVFWGLPDDDYMDCEEIEELVERYVADYEVAEEEITIYGYVRTEIKKDRLIGRFVENLIEHMDEEYTIEESNTEIADIPAVRVAALRLIDTIIANGYKVETLDKVCEKKIKISDYISGGWTLSRDFLEKVKATAMKRASEYIEDISTSKIERFLLAAEEIMGESQWQRINC